MTSNEDPNAIIFNQRHPILDKKHDIWELIYKSYKGGQAYQEGSSTITYDDKNNLISSSYLWKYPREGTNSYNARKRRAVYFNQISPIADTLSGFLFEPSPIRNDINKVSYLLDNADKKGKSFNNFMHIITIHSLLFTCGVLVESPNFNKEEFLTERDRQEGKLNPYCVWYLPFDIINFHHSGDGTLEWVILNNSYYDNSDPFVEGKDKEIYRLWTKEYYQDFEKREDTEKILKKEEVEHKLGFVPFKFVNWRDDNNDFIEESVMEDPVMIARLLYNKMSEMDEMSAAAAIECLLYPTETGKVPNEIIAGGIGSLSVIGFPGKFPLPSFAGPSMAEVSSFMTLILFYTAEIKKKVGLETDQEKDYTQSGYAKELDFKKVKALLESGAYAMQDLEKWIFETAANWENETIVADIRYNSTFNDKDILAEVQALSELLAYPYPTLSKESMKLIVDDLLTSKLPPEKIQEIRDEIDSRQVIKEEI